MVEYDCLVIGAGPAGLQAGHFLKKRNRNFRILEAADTAGTFLEKFPRHRMFLSINKIYTGYDNPERNLRFDWNSLISDDPALRLSSYTKDYYPSADDYVRYLQDYARSVRDEVLYGTRVEKINRLSEGFLLNTSSGDFKCRYLVVATGISKRAYAGVPGEELGEHYFDFSIDPQDFADQKVLIVGKGNSAFETANAITPTARMIHMISPSSIRMAWASHYLGHLRAINSAFIDTYHLKGQNSALDAKLLELRRNGNQLEAHLEFTHAKGQRMWLTYDRVLLCTGFRFCTEMFSDESKPALAVRDRLPDMTSSWESTNIPDLFFAGTLMQMRDFHRTMSNFLHGFRHNIHALIRILDQRYHREEIPFLSVSDKPRELARTILKRATNSPEIFLQPGFLCELVRLDKDGPRLYSGLPVEYIHDSDLGQGDYLILTLQYGKFEGDPLSVKRDPDPEKAHLDVYIHPIVEHFRDGELIGSCHIPENLENDWDEDRELDAVLSLGLPGVNGTIQEQKSSYRKRLQKFLERILGGVEKIGASR